MKKAILIGYFLAFVTVVDGISAGVDQLAGLISLTEQEKTPAMASRERQLQDNRPSTSGSETFASGYTIGWILAGIVLLILPLYMLFLIRKQQMMSKQIERLLADRALLFDHAPCGYHSVDERGNFTNVNNTLLQWLGYEKEEVVGKLRFADVVAGEGHEVQKQINALLEGSAAVKYLDLKRKNGRQFSVLVHEISIGQEADRSKRLFSTIDNSDCVEALERIKSLDNELESFSYSISHDLRAPLRSIDGYSKILQEDYAVELGDEGKRVLNVIMNNARRMGSLIDGLLDFGRLGRKVIQRSHINMTGMVQAVADELLSQLPGRKISVKVGALHMAFADPDMMRQVWVNLLDNAFKFTSRQADAIIQINSFKTETGEWCYQVGDNGVGFDMKYAPKLFGVFQRLHKIQDFSGTGVGLAIVKRIISKHGGRVWAEGSLEKGAVFYFTIPIEDENT